MGLVVTYYMPADATSGPWTEDLSSAVRLGTMAGVIDEAELGAVGQSSLLFDDPLATLGTSHYSDGIRGLKRIFIDETACAAGDQRLFTGWIGDRHYKRGTDSLRVGVARKLDATLVDSNVMLSFRQFAPVNGSNATEYNASNSFIRPAETDIARVNALLTVPFLTSIHDTGFVVSSGGVDMDACDYTGQHPADVLNDCAQQSGRNFFIRFDETANEFSLHYVNDTDLTDVATLRISNVLADVDNVTTFAPEFDAELVRDPSRVSAAVYLPFNGSNSPAYKTRIQTEYDYGWRDSSAPSANVKTLAKANVRAARYLTTTANEDDRITCTLKLPANVVTGIKQGQVVQAKFSHLPHGSNASWGSAFQWCRVLNRNVMADEMTNVKYNVRYELSPLGGLPSGAFSDASDFAAAVPVLRSPTTPGNLLLLMVSVAENIVITTANPPTLTNLAGGGTWTQAAFVSANPNVTPTPAIGPPGAHGFGIYWRRVAAGESAVSPVSVGSVSSGYRMGAWLWEIPGVSDPTTATTYTTGTGAGGAGLPRNGTATIGSAMSGPVVGGGVVGLVTYGARPTYVPVVGTTVQLSDGGNDNPGGCAHSWTPPFTWVGQTTDGPLSFTWTQPCDLGYDYECACGAAVVIPGLSTPLPTIPFPANQI